jgi:hypothetical protein
MPSYKPFTVSAASWIRTSKLRTEAARRRGNVPARRNIKNRHNFFGALRLDRQ